MAHRWLLPWAVVFVGGTFAADDLADFSNNLATDIGPLINLFGESMTRQYLSESTSFLDYFIFAMGPLGILTAIVSAIRVCGSPSLRAFIGRSQEGDGAIEAELCTSTSRDVCELFNKGGITRVLGRPDILELVYVPKHQSSKKSRSREPEIHLFKHYLKRFGPPHPVDACDWTTKTRPVDFKDPSWSGKTGKLQSTLPPLAPKPNISLNVGIVKQPIWIIRLIAVTGFVLQAGILLLAGLGVWILGWNPAEGITPASRDYAPIMYITGTVLLSVGMWACAALIGQTTKEVRYDRTKLEHSAPTRLVWLQPGPQVIGDQSFDPSAYCENQDDPLRSWISSTKDLSARFELHTFLAVLATLVGYIVQFIGIRGMKAWVSLAQLGVTVVMSILRGLLRVQRLSREDNRLGTMPDLVAGHELDWLAFNIAGQKLEDREFWKVTAPFVDAVVEQASGDQYAPHDASWNPKKLAEWREESTSSSDQQEDQAINEDALLVRARLAHLTGNFSRFKEKQPGSYQSWKDSQIKVRVAAKQVAAAIGQAAKALHGNQPSPNRVWLRVNAVTSLGCKVGAVPGKKIIAIPIGPVRGSEHWVTDEAQLEAILGLWTWSLMSGFTTADETTGDTIFASEMSSAFRLISAGHLDEAGRFPGDRRGEWALWLGNNGAWSAQTTSLTIDEQVANYGLTDLREHSAPRADKEGLLSYASRISAPRPAGTANAPNFMNVAHMVCGWNVGYEALGQAETSADSDNASNPPATPTELQIQHVPGVANQEALVTGPDGPIVRNCAQNLYVALVASLLRLPNLHIKATDTVISQMEGPERFQNDTLDILVSAFTESGLGSKFEAMSSILPTFWKEMNPTLDVILRSTFRAAFLHRTRNEWAYAEGFLQWACVRCLSQDVDPAFKSSYLDSVIREIGELYRWSLADSLQRLSSHDDEPEADANTGNFRLEYAQEGMRWMQQFSRDYGAQWPIVTEIVEAYRVLESKITKMKGYVTYQQSLDAANSLCESMRDGSRMDALLHLSILGDVHTGKDTDSALALAVKNDWREIVRALLEKGFDPDGLDNNGRTAASYCAELGRLDYLEWLRDGGANLDASSTTPLHWAARKGHKNVVELLLASGTVDVKRRDSIQRDALTIAIQRGHEAIAKRLIDAGAYLYSRDMNGRTPLHHAAVLRNNLGFVARDLVEKGADVNATDNAGFTPLHTAVYDGHDSMAYYLVRTGADIQAKDVRGRSPATLATERGHDEIAAWIEAYVELGSKYTGMFANLGPSGGEESGAAQEVEDAPDYITGS